MSEFAWNLTNPTRSLSRRDNKLMSVAHWDIQDQKKGNSDWCMYPDMNNFYIYVMSYLTNCMCESWNQILYIHFTQCHTYLLHMTRTDDGYNMHFTFFLSLSCYMSWSTSLRLFAFLVIPLYQILRYAILCHIIWDHARLRSTTSYIGLLCAIRVVKILVSYDTHRWWTSRVCNFSIYLALSYYAISFRVRCHMACHISSFRFH